jgi:hypothetical protein
VIAGELVRVADDRNVGAKLLGVLPHERFEVLAADLLLALDEDGEVDRQPAMRLPREDCLDMTPHLPFVVDRTAREQRVMAGIVLPHGRLERSGRPQFQRFRRLDVVMPVQQHGRPAPLVHILCDDGGMPARLHDRDVEPAELQLIGQPGRAAEHVVLVLGLGADAGDAEELRERRDRLVASAVDGGQHLIKGRHNVSFRGSGCDPRNLVVESRCTPRSLGSLPLPSG